MPAQYERRGVRVLSSFIDAVAPFEAVDRLFDVAGPGESRYACACNVHSVVTALGNAEMQRALEGSALNVPDGAPVAWALRRRGFAAPKRIAGPDLFELACERAQATGAAIFLYGSTLETATRLRQNLARRYPALRIAGWECPPFRALTQAEDAMAVDRINSSGAALVFVSLGCPKQELWMAAHHGRINATMIGVGAAFDFHAGTAARAPSWMRRCGLEWLHRLWREPRRLWRRYLVANSVFLALLARERLLDDGLP